MIEIKLIAKLWFLYLLYKYLAKLNRNLFTLNRTIIVFLIDIFLSVAFQISKREQKITKSIKNITHYFLSDDKKENKNIFNAWKHIKVKNQ